MQLLETMLGCFGSRLTLHFLPRERQVRLSPLGKHYDLPWHLALGFRVGQTRRVLPFAGEADCFPEVEMELSMTGVSFVARDRALGLTARFRFTAPFYPQDEPVSVAPFFYLDITLEQAPAGQPLELVAGLTLADPAAPFESRGVPAGLEQLQGGVVEARYGEIRTHWGPPDPPDRLSRQEFSGPVGLFLHDWPAPLSPAAAAGPGVDLTVTGQMQAGVSFGLLLAGYQPGPVLEIRQEWYEFKYTRFWPDLAAVCRYALDHAATIRGKTALFDRLLLDSSLGKSTTDFIAFTFQSYLANTWWAAAAAGPGEWFSVWEGNCVFHATVDVEYNLAWIYLLLWPQLLEMTLKQWQGYIQRDERGEWLSHDVGGLLGANRQVYGHAMEVEENCNFVLLAHALWRMSGRPGVREHTREAVARLVRFVLDSDTTGDGWPDRGTANTIDDASPAVQFGREQTYLAVKAMAACVAAAGLLADRTEYAGLVAQCQAQSERITQTLNRQAWLGDHYAVTLDRTTTGLSNPWTGQPLPPGELEGWDAYSLYTTNGLLYLLATAPGWPEAQALPPGDYNRYRQDLLSSLQHSLHEYGCTHSSHDHSHIWISQNLHRDLTAAYLGHDLSEMTGRYWAFEQYENSQGRGGCFVDTYGLNHLHYYPRGITSLGLLYALAGVRLDRTAGRLQLAPVRAPLRVPLTGLADWPAGRVPWLNFRLVQGRVELEIENEDLLRGLQVVLRPAL